MNATTQPPWTHTLQVWWAFLWRNGLLVCAGWIAVSVAALAGLPALVEVALGVAVAVGSTLLPIRAIIGKTYRGFRIEYVANDNGRLEERP